MKNVYEKCIWKIKYIKKNKILKKMKYSKK